MRRSILLFVGALLSVSIAAGCADDEGTPTVLRVPGDHATIQAAVDAASPGDMVLIEAGTYAEAVTVSTPNIVVRGVDRNAVVLDGGHELADGILVVANGVAVENLTVRNYRQNGVLFNGAGIEVADPSTPPVYGAGDTALVGYRASYVTTSNNGLYGIYAFAARDGLIEQSYASAHPDSGIYVGQCKPCEVVVRDVLAENNAIGYYGTNASGEVYVVDSVFRGNRLGITPNSQDMELLAPQVETVVAGNLVVDNDNPAAPEIQEGFFGGGIAVGGGTQNTILRNRVTGHAVYGIGLVSLNQFDPIGNRVEGNVLADNGVDLYFEMQPGDVATFDNCFTLNQFATSMPEDIETVLACDTQAGPFVPRALRPPESPPAVDYRAIPLPPPQPTMSGDVTAIPPTPAAAPDYPDLDAIEVPTG
jgi:nitrous oxidase accessory protein NosD